jgi:hypothetical protein
MKYSAPAIINCLNAKLTIQSAKEPSLQSDVMRNFITVAAYQSDE